MHIQFKETSYELTPEETALTSKKVESLAKYLGVAEADAYAYITLGKQSEAHHNGPIWFAEGNIEVSGTSYFVKEDADSLRSAVDRMIAELGREIRRNRQKKQSLFRRGGAEIKRLFSR